MTAYEMTFIVRPDLDEEHIRAVSDQVTGRITGARGEIIALYAWNPARRRLAFPIRDYGDGYYFTTTFRLDPPALREVESALRLNDRILRFLVVQATDLNIRQSQQRMQQQAAAAAAAPPQAAGAPPAPPGPATAVEQAAPPAPPEPSETGSEAGPAQPEGETEAEPVAAATTQSAPAEGEE